MITCTSISTFLCALFRRLIVSTVNMLLSDEKGKTLHIILKNLVAGGVAGMCSKTAVAPLDRIKILLQAQHEHYRHLGVFSGLKQIVQCEGFCALYKGNFVQMIRIVPYAAGQFTAYEMYKKYLGGSFGQYSHIDRFLAGAAGGVTAVTITYPLDIIRTRLAFLSNGETFYTGISDVAAKICRQEGGFRALYRGYLPNVIAIVPYAGLSFYTYEKLKYLCMKHASDYFCSKRETNTGGLVLNVLAKLLCGGIAGAVAHTVSYPLDVTKRRMQLAMMHPTTYKYAFSSQMWDSSEARLCKLKCKVFEMKLMLHKVTRSKSRARTAQFYIYHVQSILTLFRIILKNYKSYHERCFTFIEIYKICSARISILELIVYQPLYIVLSVK